MVTQCANDIYLIVADVHPEYLDYLTEGTVSRNPFQPEAFLKMHLLGPFSIFSKGHMEIFGFLVVALTIIQDRDPLNPCIER
jgi:hypothetical protein